MSQKLLPSLGWDTQLSPAGEPLEATTAIAATAPGQLPLSCSHGAYSPADAAESPPRVPATAAVTSEVTCRSRESCFSSLILSNLSPVPPVDRA